MELNVPIRVIQVIKNVEPEVTLDQRIKQAVVQKDDNWSLLLCHGASLNSGNKVALWSKSIDDAVELSSISIVGRKSLALGNKVWRIPCLRRSNNSRK